MGPRSALLSHGSLLLEIRATILPTGTWQHNLDRNLLDRRLWLLMKAFPLLPHRTKVFMLPETAPSFHRNWFSNTLNSHRQAPGSKNKMQKSGWLLETLPDERLPAINQLILLFSGWERNWMGTSLNSWCLLRAVGSSDDLNMSSQIWRIFT